MTSSKSWRKAAELYRAVLGREEARRAAYLEEACAGDEALFQEVLSLLSGVGRVELSPESPATDEGEPGVGSDPLSRTASRDGAWVPPAGGASIVGQQWGHYEIVSRIGAGGMGEVFRARDLKLGRDVAIKVMHQGFSSKPDRVRRFEREARAAAALNHPAIATIYEVGSHEGTPFIAMELVEGRTLRELIQGGPLRVSEVLRLATQIAGGLAKAHAAGIVHRDLKPGNLMITSDGFAKILDFGLVKLLSRGADSGGELTEEGSVVGTVEYMSPEQALATPVDHRSDQFSFGSILHEMATGRGPFHRDTAAQTLVAIIRDEPRAIRKASAEIPVALSAVVERCLAKEPEKRYASTEELAAELGILEVAAISAGTGRSTRRRPLAAIAAVAAVAAAVAGLSWLVLRPAAPEPGAAMPEIVPLTSYPGREAEPSFSPEGSQVAFTWNGDSQTNQDIYVKALGAERPLRLTSDPALDASPAWSPDGRQIAFLRDKPGGGSEVRLVPPTGGPERRLAEIAAAAEYGLSWSPDGRRLAAVDRSSSEAPLGIVLIDPDTGRKEPLTSLAESAGRGDAWPIFSPDGRTVAFKRSVAPTANFVCLVPVEGGDLRRLASTTAVTSPVAWTAGGEEIIFPALTVVREGAPPVPSTRSNSGAPPVLWRISADGGQADQLPGTANAMGVAVSRQGRRLAFTQEASEWDIWRVDLRSREPQIRLIDSTRFDGNAQFAPDDQKVVFTSARSGAFEIWVGDSEGANLLRLTSLGSSGSAGSPRWSSDGTRVAFDFLAEGDTGADIFVVGASGGPPRRVTTSASPDVRPSWSKDGQWIYFASHRSGEWQVWKVPSDGEKNGNARQVTQGGGYSSIESIDGKHLFFTRRRSVPDDPENSIWTVPVEGGDEEIVIESLMSSDTNWDVAGEGIYYVDRHEPATPREHWVVNYFSFEHRRASEMVELLHPPRLAGPALSVSSDGRWVLVSQLLEESDLMLVEDFR